MEGPILQERPLTRLVVGMPTKRRRLFLLLVACLAGLLMAGFDPLHTVPAAASLLAVMAGLSSLWSP